ncbi:DUF3575 domain-containing protein [Spirosoma sp. HMF4905]|uniref:DUF3575 domain-containing protein n=1 Tax=Spirosoma arboris TaxID=2682092 RepID=A0A7K1SQG7_9BACT|nr:DUF3575 domain-containing protein [Spirosoma arboris]MVM36048.1 DUF3575 domain-containing protein [Spirosoma arboris]
MKNVRLIGLIALFFGGVSIVLAQSVKPLPLPSLDAEQSQRWVVKFAPLSLFDPNNTVQFGIERLLGQHQSIQAEFGYGPQAMNLWRNSTSSRYSDNEIWRGRAEWRYYWHGGPIGSYMALEGLYLQKNAYENGTVGIGCETGPCQYYQLYSSPIAKRVWAGHLKFGRQFPLSPDKRFLADFYGGLGVRWSTLDRSSVPGGLYYFQSNGISLVDPFSYTPHPTISLSYGIKFGYSF